MKPKIPRSLRPVETFFDTWTDNMAWLLGYFASDGTMYHTKSGYGYIAFTSCDKDLLDQVKQVLKIDNVIEIYHFKNPNWKTRYTLQIGSRKIYQRFIELGFTPKKSLTLKFPPIPDQFFPHFLRGYFDGDGCATFTVRHRPERGNRIFKQLLFRLTCGSYEFLQAVKQRIEILCSIKGGSIFSKSNSKGNIWHELAYSTQNVIKLYNFIYPTQDVPHLRRKRVILEEGIKSMRPYLNWLESHPVTVEVAGSNPVGLALK